MVVQLSFYSLLRVVALVAKDFYAPMMVLVHELPGCVCSVC